MCKTIECQNCGATFEAKKSWAKFCGAKCRDLFNNRRKDRGAVLYDFFMQNRFDRMDAEGLQTLMSRLGMFWREEDKAERNGRESWADPKDFLDANPWLKAVYLQQAAKRSAK